MSVQKRIRGPRKSTLKQDSFQTLSISDHDREIALGVCQVVRELICQVADEPYGDLSRKRPSFFNVMRRFVKDSVHEFNEAAASEIFFSIVKKTRNDEQREVPYGMDLVWGVVLAEMEKIDKKERARVYSAQKSARQRERKRQEALEAERAALTQMWDAMRTESDMSGDEQEEKHMGRLVTPHVRESNHPSEDAALMNSPCSSRRSDDSDWAIRPHSNKKPLLQKPVNVRSLNFPMHPMSQTKPNYPIFNIMGRGRGRGRGRGVRTPTVRSILDAAISTACSSSQMDEDDGPPLLHPSVSLNPPGQTMKPEPTFDFSGDFEKEKKYVIREPSSATRGKRGRARGRGRGAKTGTLRWYDDAEEYQQRLMAESIETSGESASQESYDDITNTIDEVVKRVNGMTELNGGRKGLRSKKIIEPKEEKEKKMSKSARVTRASTRGDSTIVNYLKREISNPTVNEVSTPSVVKRRKESTPSGVKRRKEEVKRECDVITIDSSSVESDEDSLFSLDTPNASAILDSSCDEFADQESKTAAPADDNSSNSDIFILDV